MLKEIGKIIREQRRSLGYSIEQLAEYSETSFSTISRIELGKIEDIHLSTLLKILNALQLQMDVYYKNSQTSVETIQLLNFLSNLPQKRQEKTAKLLLELLKLNSK
ncbi:helix-turn-helix domain-containing protein [Ligilactobacillus sp. LYQ135]